MTTPSTIGEERRTNPFMRCTIPEVIEHVKAEIGAERSPAAVLGAIRAKKDVFK